MTSVVVSGASRGLGRAICLDLASDWDVTGFARGEPEPDDNSPPRLNHIGGVDVADARTWDVLDESLATADALVNNVGVAYDGLLATQGVDSIVTTVQVNLVSILVLTKRYLRLRLAARRPGIIVSVSSIIAIRGYS